MRKGLCALLAQLVNTPVCCHPPLYMQVKIHDLGFGQRRLQQATGEAASVSADYPLEQQQQQERQHATGAHYLRGARPLQVGCIAPVAPSPAQRAWDMEATALEEQGEQRMAANVFAGAYKKGQSAQAAAATAAARRPAHAQQGMAGRASSRRLAQDNSSTAYAVPPPVAALLPELGYTGPPVVDRTAAPALTLSELNNAQQADSADAPVNGAVAPSPAPSPSPALPTGRR